jgi:hypothetical protein
MVGAVKVPSGVTIWNAMRDELLMNLYQLPFTTLPPTIFHVYLHPGDFERIEGIVPRIISELQKALTEEVRRMNEGRARAGGVLSRLIQPEEASPIEVPAAGWEVHLHADRNDALKPGDLGIESMMPLPPPVEFGGPPTTRIVRSVLTGAGRSSTTIEVQQPALPSQVTLSAVEAPGAEFTKSERACLRYEDDQGPHVFSMRKDVLSVGRGGSSVWVDVQVVTSPKVSREHFRLRADRAGGFFIQDFSAWGTSVNGQPLAAAVTASDGVLRPGAEQPLQSPARIELADALVMHFEAKLDK